MKKVFVFVLAAIMLLSLFACAGSGGKGGLQVGYSRQDITPTYEVHMAGGDWKSRISNGFIDPLYVTCVAVKSGDDTLLIYTMDFLGAYVSFCDPATAQISAETGVPAENIWMNATHTHSGVAIYTDWGKAQQYRESFYKAAVKAAKEAIEDLTAAEIYYGGTQAEGMAFVRHYNMSDGTVAGANFGSFSSDIVGHTIDADVELQLVRFDRGEEKQDVLLMSFPAHCTLNQNSKQLSADYPGPCREYVEDNADVLVAFFQGASGDQVPSSRIPGEAFSSNYREYGEELGRIAVEALPTLTKSESSSLKHATFEFVGDAMKEGVEKTAEAAAVQAVIDQYGKSSSEAKASAQQNGFSSVYEATSVLDRNRSAATETMLMRTLALGDVGFVFAPYEMFCKHAVHIKENSPFAQTFISTLGYGNLGYLPSLEACEYGSYEYCVTKFARGTGETVADKYVEMLTEMKNAG